VPKLYWEDFTPGIVREHGPRLVTREDIVAFAAEFDPQPMHLDEEAARSSMLGGLSASGWHACSLAMRMACDGILLDSTSMGAPGVDEAKWMAPIRPGDELTLRMTVLDSRASKSRPDMGIVKIAMELRNGVGATAMHLTTSLMMGRRAGGSPA
jgi:acyl dehydratase